MPAFARSLPLAKAIHEDTLVAYEMNGEAIPPEHGGPVRAVVPGWYATDSVKWLERIRVSAVEFDGPFQALDYRLAEAGKAGPGRSLGRIPVHSLVTEPADGEALRAGRATIHGVAWSGAGPVAAVDVRIDRGAWTPATITSRTGAYGRALWALDWDADGGRHVIAVRARDASGDAQPGEPVWNRRGYANCIHRITVVVEEGPDGHVRT